MLYTSIRKLLFCLPPEMAHRFSLFCLKKMPSSWFADVLDQPVDVLGLHFKNPIGLAAGFDKNGDYIDILGKLGFGFIEVGTVTPKPQEGNPKPRLFRLPKKKALINRMGFNNKGVDYLIERLKKRTYSGIIGVNIGKNASTPMEEAIEDYLIGLKKVYPYADYISINISSPNTSQLRQLQQGEYLHQLLLALSDIRSLLAKEQGIYKPILLKISPDETEETLKNLVRTVSSHKIDGIIATNTTLDRACVVDLPHAEEKGGLSGQPLFAPSTKTLSRINNLLAHEHRNMLLIGVGGIMKSADLLAKFEAGAQLVQVYTGLIYRGPFWIKRLVKTCATSPSVLRTSTSPSSGEVNSSYSQK